MSADASVYPWHAGAWDRLWARPMLPHALLLTGVEGIGKRRFGRAVVDRLLCEAPGSAGACGQCASCRLLAADTHPDFRLVVPDGDGETDADDGDKKAATSRQIKIDQIRALEEFVYVGSYRGGARVALIDPAEAMNPAAANALLKILEEPPERVHFLLVASRYRLLLPTIRSRCRMLKLPRPAAADASAWLERQAPTVPAELLDLLGGTPLSVLREIERGHAAALAGLLDSLSAPGDDPLALAARWESWVKGGDSLPMTAFVEVVQKFLFDLCLYRIAGTARFVAPQRLAGKAADVAFLIRCYNDLMKMRALAAHPLNPRLFLEELAERYLRALASSNP